MRDRERCLLSRLFMEATSFCVPAGYQRWYIIGLCKDSSPLPSFIFLNIGPRFCRKPWANLGICSYIISFQKERQQVNLHSTGSSSEPAESSVLAFKADGSEMTWIGPLLSGYK